MGRYSTIIIVVLVAGLLSQVQATYAQNAEFEQISKIINAGNAKDLVKQFSASVELNIDGEEANFSKAQAEAVVKDFFTKSSPTSFVINHKGASKGGLPYAIGEYKSNSDTYRVWIRLQKTGTQFLVDEISFIKE